MTRLETRMRDALEGNEREVLDQQIERLSAEKRQIEQATID